MTKDRYVLWTDINLNFDDWKDDLLSEYPELSENELIEKMKRAHAASHAIDMLQTNMLPSIEIVK